MHQKPCGLGAGYYKWMRTHLSLSCCIHNQQFITLPRISRHYKVTSLSPTISATEEPNRWRKYIIKRLAKFLAVQRGDFITGRHEIWNRHGSQRDQTTVVNTPRTPALHTHIARIVCMQQFNSADTANSSDGAWLISGGSIPFLWLANGVVSHFAGAVTFSQSGVCETTDWN